MLSMISSRTSMSATKDKVTGWHNHVFRCMPGPLARMAGRLMYPHLS